MSDANREMIAKSLVALAKKVNAAERTAAIGEEQIEKLVKINPSLNQAARRLSVATSGDVSDMLTTVIMAAKLGGDVAAANKMFTLFKPLLKRI